MSKSVKCECGKSVSISDFFARYYAHVGQTAICSKCAN